jgi:hypothetical protein
MALGKKVVAKKETAKKDTKPTVTVKGQDFAEKVSKFNELKETKKNAEAEMKSLEGDIKSTCLDEYVKLYTEMKRNPESIRVQTESGDKVLFVVVKKYSGAVDEDRATELREKYGEKFVEEKSDLVMNPALYEKYAEKLEKLILGDANDFMTDEEKEELFTNRVTYNIKSDAINEAFTAGKGDVEGLISDTNPVLMLKETR